MTRDVRTAGAVVEETGHGDFQVLIRTGGIDFFADEPADMGGLGSGPTPFDLLSAALGACTAITLRLYARMKSIPLQHVRVEVRHQKDGTQKVSDRFDRLIYLDGPLSDEQKARLLEIAGRCPVHRTMSSGARIDTTLGLGDAAHSSAEPLDCAESDGGRI